MENSQYQLISFKIMDQEFAVNCPRDKIQELKTAIHYLEKKMRELNSTAVSTNNILKLDHLAVITALNITRELMHNKNQKTRKLNFLTENIQKLKNKIEQMLALPA